ncbi:hypothetical protein [Pseudomonas sp. RIT288]|jgi:hypothetical protein|uniref:hypothetical protein n=1 Tax=Pseudomonas sp. RIT288 TaxID=1470589 RepID=UPI00044957F9|nr:hypothetical protein [Pseudomonas sp. RIT288]EZP26439.1 hypothetical protein BW33_04857 [Pseudomonas sp. RIT288]
MSLIEKLISLIKPEPRQEQIAGYSKQELKSLFSRPLAQTNLPVQPPTTSLESADICAFFSQFLIEPNDLVEFESLVESHFRKNTERTFNDLPVFEYDRALSGDRLIFFASTREFNSVTIRLITNSLDFLTMLNRKKFAVPPPWFAFEGYEPSWWGGSMQGAQEYYDNNYFFSFFTQLSDIEKQSYYSRFRATDEWIERLELMYDTE